MALTPPATPQTVLRARFRKKSCPAASEVADDHTSSIVADENARVKPTFKSHNADALRAPCHVLVRLDMRTQAQPVRRQILPAAANRERTAAARIAQRLPIPPPRPLRLCVKQFPTRLQASGMRHEASNLAPHRSRLAPHLCLHEKLSPNFPRCFWPRAVLTYTRHDSFLDNSKRRLSAGCWQPEGERLRAPATQLALAVRFLRPIVAAETQNALSNARCQRAAAQRSPRETRVTPRKTRTFCGC
jgi:hypothetical protein